MPAVVVAVAATQAAAAVVTAFQLVGLTAALVSAGVAAVVSFAGASLLGLNKRPSAPSVEPFAAENQGRQVILRSAVTPRRVIYGEAVLSGPLMYACKSGTEPDPWLHLVIALAGHECDSITGVFLGEDEITDSMIAATGYVTSGKYAVDVPVARVQTGTVPATPFAVTAEHAVSSVQSVTVTLTYNNEEGDVPYDVALTEGNGYSRSGNTFTFDAAYEGKPYTFNYTEATTEYYVRIKRYLGTDSQIADADLIAASAAGDNARWTSAHRGRGLTYIIVSLRRNNNLFPTGAPNIKARVKGKKLYDPRTATTAWSNNAALCQRDWLVSSYGLGCASAEIGSTLFNAAANVCDEDVDLSATPGDTQKRYTVDGVISLDDAPLDVLERLLSSSAGAAIFSFGTWDVYAGAYQTPTYTIDESDLRGPITVTPRPSRKDLFNAVGGTYIDPTTNQATSFRPQTNSTYETQDGGSRIMRNIELPFVRNEVRAQRLAKIALEKSRQGRTIQWPGKMTVFRLNTWKTVNVTVGLLGLSSNVNLVTGWKWDPQGGVDLTLQEEASTVYDWDYGDATTRDSAPDTNLPSVNGAPGAPGAPTVTEEIYETTGSAGVKVRTRFAWEASVGPFVRHYYFEYKRPSDAAFQRLKVFDDTAITLEDVADGYVLARTQAENDLGVLSEYSPTSLLLLRGLTEIPADVEELAITPIGEGKAVLSWKRHPDLDVRIGGQIAIRFSPSVGTPTWNESTPLDPPGDVQGGATSVEVPLRTGTYMVKARDSGGRLSENAVSALTTAPDLEGYNAVETVTAEPTWEGTKSHVFVSSGKLRLGSGSLISEMTDPMSEWGQIITLGGVASEGYIVLDEVVDLGAVYTSRLTLAMETLSFHTDDKVSHWLQPMSTWGLVSGPEIGDTRAEIFVATTDDDPSGAPVWTDYSPFVIGLKTARGYKFKARLRSGHSEHNIEIETLVITIDMPDRDQALDFTTSSSGDTSVTWTLSPGFKVTPKLGVTLKNLATGDYPVITAESATGFTVNTYNAAGTRVVRNGTARAKGY